MLSLSLGFFALISARAFTFSRNGPEKLLLLLLLLSTEEHPKKTEAFWWLHVSVWVARALENLFTILLFASIGSLTALCVCARVRKYI